MVKKIIEKLWIYWRIAIGPIKRSFFLLLVLSILVSLFELSGLTMMMSFLDGVTNPDRFLKSQIAPFIRTLIEISGLTPTREMLIFFTLCIAGSLYVIKGFMVSLNQYCSSYIAHGLYIKTKQRIFSFFLKAEYTFISAKGRGGILSDLNQPAEDIEFAFVNLGKIILEMITIVAQLCFIFYFSGWIFFFLGIIAFGIVYFWKNIVLLKSIRIGREIYEARTDISKTEIDAMDGIKVVKSYILSDNFLGKYKAILAREFKSALNLVLLKTSPTLFQEIVVMGMVVSLSYICFFAPSFGLTFSTLVVILISIRRLIPSISGFLVSAVELGRRLKGVEQIESLLYKTPIERTDGRERLSSIESVKFENVSFRYSGQSKPPILKDLNLQFEKGRMTALVGPSGAGKSTIANLIAGFFHKESGDIKINGISIENIALESLRSKIGYISQDIFLFNESLKNNITLWRSNISEEQFNTAIKLAHLESVVQDLPGKFDTIVGDRGLKLSGGQCQRVAIARAIVNKPDILIFDEATSALDNLTEKIIYEAIDSFRSQSVVIVIAHRLETIKNADQIVVLEGGFVVDHGTHDELINKNNLYAKLYGKK
ncbi:MAG: ABC transporter ATP-binding protein [Elusimicrobiota bacterium]